MLWQRRIYRRLEMEIGPLKEGFAVQMPQPNNEVIPRLPCRGLVLAPSNSGKTNAVVTMLTDKRFYRGMFRRIYWCSPTASVDPALDPLRRYVETLQDQKEDPTFHDTVDVPFLQSRVDRAKKVMETLKTRKIEQKGFHTMIVLDDLADVKRGTPADRAIRRLTVREGKALRRFLRIVHAEAQAAAHLAHGPRELHVSHGLSPARVARPVGRTDPRVFGDRQQRAALSNVSRQRSRAVFVPVHQPVGEDGR